MARLQRSLSLGAVVLFGIAYMTPIIVLGTFGILAEITRGAVPAAYVAASVAMFFTALSYARMARLFPVAGSAYSYVRRSISDHLGFIAGWAVLLDYLFLPMAIWLIVLPPRMRFPRSLAFSAFSIATQSKPLCS